MKQKQSKTKQFFATLVMAFFAVSAIALGVANRASAQTTPSLPELVTCSGAACKWCDVFSLLQRVFNTAEVIVFPLVVVYILYGATLYIISSTSGSEEGLKKARATVTDALIGLVLVLLTFVIVNATITGITGSKIQNFISVDCSVVDTGTGDIVIAKPQPEPTPDQKPGPQAQGSMTEDEVRNIMSSANPKISINNGKCPDAVNKYKGCTNLAGMRGDTINGILQTNYECKQYNGGSSCNLMITGGTELDGHSPKGMSHPAGFKVDFDRPNGPLKGSTFPVDQWITHYCGSDNCSYGKRSGDNAELFHGPNGSIWANEGSHWDVTFP